MEKIAYKKLYGFTLVEMLVAVAVFSIIMVMTVGSFLSIVDANQQAQAKKTVVNNLNFALENMTRNIRTGDLYHCIAPDENYSDFKKPRDCSEEPEVAFTFRAFNNDAVVYQYDEGKKSIERSVNGGDYLPITAPEVEVLQMRFFVSGAEKDDAGQPRVLMVLNGRVKGRARVASEFEIETLVSQRLLDLHP